LWDVQEKGKTRGRAKIKRGVRKRPGEKSEDEGILLSKRSESISGVQIGITSDGAMRQRFSLDSYGSQTKARRA